MLPALVLKIKRRENVFYAALYHAAKSFYAFSLPSVRPLHLPLYYLDRLIKETAARFVQTVWSVPLFKARCAEAGRGLRLPNGIPLVTGNHLTIKIGDNVTIGRSTIGAGNIYDRPVFTMGANSSIGYGTSISVAHSVTIGRDTMISMHCLIMDNDDHPVSPVKRLLKEPAAKESVRPVRIGNNVWVGAYSAIMKGVSIGDNAIIGTHSVVTADVPANTIFAGVPARMIKQEIDRLDSHRKRGGGK